jgi:negative regulator of sigma E activity
MKRYVQDMSPEQRKVWRRWQTRWTCFYAVVLAVLIGIGFFNATEDTEFAQSRPSVQRLAGERPGMPVHLK